MHPYLRVFGFTLPSYGVMCALGVVCALVLSLARVLRARRLRADIALILFTGALVFGLLGALFTYALVTYGASELLSMLRRGAFSREFSPGYVFYGGLAAGVFAVWALCRVLRAPIRAYARAMVPALPLAHAFGRVGCYMAGCCYGADTCEALGVHYPEASTLSGAPVLPVQLIEAALLLLVCAVLLLRAKRKNFDPLREYAYLYAPMRFTLEFFRGDAIRGALWGLSTSQWVSLILLLLALLPVKSHRKG